MHSRKRYMLRRKLNQSPIYMLLYISRGGAQTGQKRGRWEMQMRGQKANVSRCRIDVLNFRLLESAFDLFLANV